MAKEETPEKAAEKAAKKAAMAKLKALREERKDIIAKNRDILKQQNTDTGLIKKSLEEGAKTIPEIAKSTGIKSDLVLYYVSAMKKYGELKDGGHGEDYLKYALA